MTLLDPTPHGIDELDEALLCTAVEHITHDVMTFVLAVPGDRALVFEAGQYVTVTVDTEEGRLSRCYSITSPAVGASTLSITVKRVPGGPVSSWLHEHLRPGQRVHVTGPLGHFGSTRVPGVRELHLGAGSGLTPLMGMVRTIAALGAAPGTDVVLVHHARTPADILFRSELERLHDLHPWLRVVVVCEADGDEGWSGRRGRISRELIADVASDVAERDVLVCGPAPYRQLAREVAVGLGANPLRMHEESYDVGDHADERDPDPAPPGATHTVEFRRSGRTLSCPGTSTILEAAAVAGIVHPSSCRLGMCGTCKTTMLSGSVEMNHNGGIRPREIAADKILLCCSIPTDDIVLDA